MGFKNFVSSGDYRASLEAARDAIADDLDACESMRDRAALYLRLTDVLARIDALEPGEQKGDAVDEIAERRAARRSGRATG